MVLPVGLRMCPTSRDILRKHSRIATFRNLCQMKHTHASGRRWENCFGCHRCVMTWRHGCLFLERSKRNRCTELNKHWKQSWDSCMLTCMHACVYRAGMRPSWFKLTMLNWDQSISTLSATHLMRRTASTTVKVSVVELFSLRDLWWGLWADSNKLWAWVHVRQSSMVCNQCVKKVLRLEDWFTVFFLHFMRSMSQREVVIWLESDSSSALQLVRSMDVPRRSRHIEIRLHWLREQMREGLLKLRHRSGVENPADLFTKCLSAKAFYKHRYALGIVVPDGLTAELAELRELCVLQQVLTQGSSIAIVELCCSEHSNLRKVCEVSKVPYIGVVAKVQSSGTLSRVAVCIRQWKNSSCPPWVHIHASTPCGSGSPLRNFNQDSVTEKDQEWDEIINAIGGYFKHADSCSFELPERNAIWSRPETVNLLESFDMRHQALVRLCKTGCQNKDGIPIGKTLKFVSNSIGFSTNLHSKLSTCTCQIHAELNQINYTETAFYNRKLARYILIAVKHAAKKSWICVWKGDTVRDRSWRFISFFLFCMLF